MTSINAEIRAKAMLALSYGSGNDIEKKEAALREIYNMVDVDPVCQHGTALDVHCCNCHSGFIFDLKHECPEPLDAVAPAEPQTPEPSWADAICQNDRDCQCSSCQPAAPVSSSALLTPEVPPAETPPNPDSPRVRVDALTDPALGALLKEQPGGNPDCSGCFHHDVWADRAAAALRSLSASHATTEASWLEGFEKGYLKGCAEKATTEAEAFKALEWMTHLIHGVSKDGGRDISEQEWEDCMEAAESALAAHREQKGRGK